MPYSIRSRARRAAADLLNLKEEPLWVPRSGKLPEKLHRLLPNFREEQSRAEIRAESSEDRGVDTEEVWTRRIFE